MPWPRNSSHRAHRRLGLGPLGHSPAAGRRPGGRSPRSLHALELPAGLRSWLSRALASPAPAPAAQAGTAARAGAAAPELAKGPRAAAARGARRAGRGPRVAAPPRALRAAGAWLWAARARPRPPARQLTCSAPALWHCLRGWPGARRDRRWRRPRPGPAPGAGPAPSATPRAPALVARQLEPWRAGGVRRVGGAWPGAYHAPGRSALGTGH